MFLRTVLAAVAASVSLATIPASASNPNALGWSRTMNNVLSWNDLQSTPSNTVFNTTGCSWNDMDDILDMASGKLAAGQTTSDTLCNVTDYGTDGFEPHLILFQITAGTGLTVTLSDGRGHVWTATRSGKTYQLCVADPMYVGDNNPADFPPIPGTSGGVGYVTDYTLTIKAAKTAQLGAAFEIAPSHSLGEFGYIRGLPGVPCP